MNMDIDQTRLAILTMELELKVKEYKRLCSILDELKKENISPNDGTICISSKSTDWENHKNLVNVIISIFDLLQNPNTDHGLNNEALLLYKNNKEEFEKTAREFTKKNAFDLCE